ncbi:hypothetical protein ABEF92_006539 [Exophiala dermatitidis]|uniref:Uncharacterized protein n=1 Tax=Exophiala dermatitidis (strain ATCC 34100 / CBS 525.76 / NIH/UT8656) TaxID=858893 RepID=H6C842_EXODN|nr:uncharacterized protein HMPREF1120_08237 [Exophiala dermatitidis NIH/UT8656]EHY60269.1 hypothetical protein HMPREF1120_08237 [Exophiala dermatitidis NIH/UT8656]
MSLFRSVKSLIHRNHSDGAEGESGFRTAKTETELFPPTRPEVDGEECLHDCTSCTTHYPAKFSIDESDKLYGHVKGWNTHLIVGTGKTDWVRDVTDEKGSVMQAVGKAGLDRKNGKIMLSASNLPPSLDHDHHHDEDVEPGTSDCLLLPAWVVIEKVAPSKVETLLREVVEQSPTNTTPLRREQPQHQQSGVGVTPSTANGHVSAGNEEVHEQQQHKQQEDVDVDVSKLHINDSLEPRSLPATVSSNFRIRPIPHDYLILMCSHKTRDARCGQSAPLLRKEFERILRPMGLYRDFHDDRPGGVGIYFINHVGGHKYSANVLIYRRATANAGGQRPSQNANNDRNIDKDKGKVDSNSNPGSEGEAAAIPKEAVQLIWLARVRPEDCENIVRYTILQGKVVKPKSQLRAGFDREKCLVSW